MLNPPGSVKGPGGFRLIYCCAKIAIVKNNLVIFDGSNFFHLAKGLCPDIHLTNFNYRGLAEEIAFAGCIIEYCVGEIKRERENPKSEKMYADQQSLFYNLEKQGVVIKRGFMLKHNGVYIEKGVDVRIATDILRGALKDEYGKCFVVSSDTDLIPAITDARETKKEIIYVGFENFISRALRVNCFGTALITKGMLAKYASKSDQK